MNKSRIDKINQVLADYFEKNQSISSVRAMDMMDEFVRAGIFRNDSVREGLPIRNLLRELYKTNQLDYPMQILSKIKRIRTGILYV